MAGKDKTVKELEQCIKACKKDQLCVQGCEDEFVEGGGTIVVQPGGKVFTDQKGGKVFIPNQ